MGSQTGRNASTAGKAHLTEANGPVTCCVINGPYVVVEGREKGMTKQGVAWPDNVISYGLFCNVFEFEGNLIKRVHIYVDPDFTSCDSERIKLLKGV